MLASNTSECDVEQAQKVLKLIDVLEDLDDVQEVYSNGQFPDAAYE
jgi:transcriptional/translational regulatory protein YebC/TACO1